MNDHKLIMENWRQFLNENISEMTSEQLREALKDIAIQEGAEVNENFLKKAAGIAALIASLAGGTTASAADGGKLKGLEIVGDNGVEYQLTFDEITGPLQKEFEEMTQRAEASGNPNLTRVVELGQSNLLSMVKAVGQSKGYQDVDIDADDDGFADQTITGQLSANAGLTVALENYEESKSGGAPDSPEPVKSVSSGGAANVAGLAGMLAVQQGKDPEAAKVKAQQLLDLDQSKIQTGTSSPEVEKVLQKIVKGERVTQSDIQTMKASLK